MTRARGGAELDTSRPGVGRGHPNRSTRGSFLSRVGDLQEQLALIWRLSSHWWVIFAVLALALTAIFLGLWLGRDLRLSGTADDPYLLRHLLADGADIALKLGAVIGGMLAIYRYWYQRHEPLIYFVSCGLVPVTVLQSLRRNSPAFARLWKKQGLPEGDNLTDEQWESLHNLPMIVLTGRDLETLGVKEGSRVDLRFDPPEGTSIWTTAYAFSYDSVRDPYCQHYPVGISLSLRRYFRMERPLLEVGPGADGKPGEPPAGWQRVEVYRKGLALLSGTIRQGKKMVWMASDHYSVRFRDPLDPSLFFGEDDEGTRRILEYVGISLRVYRRSGLRYRGE